MAPKQPRQRSAVRTAGSLIAGSTPGSARSGDEPIRAASSTRTGSKSSVGGERTSSKSSVGPEVLQHLERRPSGGAPASGAVKRSESRSRGSPKGSVAGRSSSKSSIPPSPVEGVPWSSEVRVPQRYQSQPVSIPQTELRGITLGQLRDLAGLIQDVLAKVSILDQRKNSPITWETINMYHIDPNFVKPLTARFKCSFVELVATGSQAPAWFVSHWWGTDFCQTLKLLGFHSARRGISVSTPYWICTFANNQHDLSNLGGSLQETPFVKAILSAECVGTVALLDYHVTTLNRIWCVLESFVSTKMAKDVKEVGHLYDIAAWLPEGAGTFGGKPVPAKATLRIDLGDGRMREAVENEETGGAFPLAVSGKGVTIDVREANASRAEDKRHILHLIAGTPEASWEEDPPAACAAYDGLNRNARQLFAAGALYGAALRDDLEQLRRLLQEFPEMKDATISDGATALCAAVWKNHPRSLQELLSSRADPNILKEDGTSAIFLAAQSGHEEMPKLLIAAEADPNRAREDGVTPLFISAQKKMAPVVEALLAARADPNRATDKGSTALLVAVDQGAEKVVMALLKSRADPCLAGATGVTPLQAAKQNKKIVQALRDAGAEASQAGSQCKVALLDALDAGVDLGLERGAAEGAGARTAARPKARASSKGRAKRAARSAGGAAPGDLASLEALYEQMGGGGDANVDPRMYEQRTVLQQKQQQRSRRRASGSSAASGSAGEPATPLQESEQAPPATQAPEEQVPAQAQQQEVRWSPQMYEQHMPAMYEQRMPAMYEQRMSAMYEQRMPAMYEQRMLPPRDA